MLVSWILNSSSKAYILLNWHVTCLIILGINIALLVGTWAKILRQNWQKWRLHAQHKHMLHGSQLNPYLHLTFQNTGSLKWRFYFQGQKYIFGIIPPPQLTCTGLCTYVLCSKRTSCRSYVFLTLKIKSAT